MFNSFGNILRLTSFGESHGKGVGGVIDGFPAGIVIDMDFVQAELDRRRPGQSRITTARKEGDKVEFLSGIFEGKSTGCPIGFFVWNQNQHSDDYKNLKEVYRVLKEQGTFLLVADIYQKEDLPEQVRENIQRFHLFNPPPEEFRELLENAGFEEVRIRLKDGEDWICAEGHK